MSARAIEDLLDAGETALAAADWGGARAAFEASLAERRSPEALDGLGRALWWLGRTGEAIARREEAYAAFRKAGRTAQAARVALWLSREHAAVPGNEAVANGWMRRARGLLRDAPPSAAQGWLALARAGRETDPIRMADRADEAREAALRFGDPDLEIRALARSGLALVRAGRVDEGMGRLDEAMAAATGGEAADPETFAETCCDLVAACEVTLDESRLAQWGEVVERFLADRPHAPLLSFCGTCCAEVAVARGNLEEAERWLVQTIEMLEARGHKARCVEPKARLAEIRVAQGRLEDAERLLAGIEGRPEALRAVVGLHLARGETAPAAALLHARLNRLGRGTPGAGPVLALLVPVQLERGDLAGARRSVALLASLADRASDDRLRAAAELARGRVTLAEGGPAAAVLTSAVERYERLEMPLDAARARLDLARALAGDQPEVAAAEARSAATVLEGAGAARHADRAEALLRDLGGRRRTGPKGVGLLTRREREVLELLREGLSNAEIAGRLYISTKTAGNHVSNVLSKLHLRSRAEAAAYAARHLGPLGP
jgi:DNA-binding CsgD family transcriptional regulator